MSWIPVLCWMGSGYIYELRKLRDNQLIAWKYGHTEGNRLKDAEKEL